jgi:2-hydroxychromene-2-carboxylate isomerase
LHGQFPTAPLHLAYLGALALGQQEAAMKCFFEAMWVAPTDVNSDEGAIKVMANAGIENAETLWANRAANQARMDEIEEQAVQDGVFGVPSFVVDGRIYFGNDRLMFLEEELV